MRFGSCLLPGVWGLACLASSPALSWQASNLHRVYPVEKGRVEVLSRPGSGPQQFWCAAGDYAIRRDRVAGTQRIYLWAPIGPALSAPGHKAVQFSYSAPPDAGGDAGYSLSVRKVGYSLRAAAARQYCLDDDWHRPWKRF